MEEVEPLGRASGEESPASPVPSEPPELIRSLRERAVAGSDRRADRIERLKVEIKLIESERKSLDSIAAVMDSVATCIADERWSGAVRTLRGAKRLREQLEQFDAASPSAVDEIERWLETRADEAIAAIPRTLIAALGDERPDPESRSPRFVFRRSFLTVEINRKKYEATAFTRVGKKTKLDADATAIADHVRTELARCFDRQTDLGEFAERLRKAYLKTDAGRRGQPARIRHVAEQLGDDTQLDEFSVDLARLLATNSESAPAASGLKLDHTKDTDHGLLLPGLEERGYFGTISYASPREPENDLVDA